MAAWRGVLKHLKSPGVRDDEQVRTFKVSNDPKFAEKVTDVVGLYMNPPDKALVLCVDEKSQIHFIPTSSSWLNLVERFFAEITGKKIRCGAFASVAELMVNVGVKAIERGSPWLANCTGSTRSRYKGLDSLCEALASNAVAGLALGGIFSLFLCEHGLLVVTQLSQTRQLVVTQLGQPVTLVLDPLPIGVALRNHRGLGRRRLGVASARRNEDVRRASHEQQTE